MPDRILRLGALGDDVAELQRLLNAWRSRTGDRFPELEVDRVFGRDVDAAVRAFQRDRGLVVDGDVGPATWGALLPDPPMSGSIWALPLVVRGRPVVTSPYGYRVHPVTGETKHHDGIDFRADSSTPLVAVAPGKVIRIDIDQVGRGRYNGHGVWISCGGWRFAYLHLSVPPVVELGDEVLPGGLLGWAGSTGRSTGPHLHFQAWNQAGQLVDPATLWPSEWLARKGA